MQATRYYESEFKMDATSIVVPSLQTFLSTEELQYLQTRRDSVDMVLKELELDSIQTDSANGITTQRLTVGVKGHSGSSKWSSWFIPYMVLVLIRAIVVVFLVNWRTRRPCLFVKRTGTRPAPLHQPRLMGQWGAKIASLGNQRTVQSKERCQQVTLANSQVGDYCRCCSSLWWRYPAEEERSVLSKRRL
jgi:hypothetical protein